MENINSPLKSFGENLRKHRKKAKMTQKKLAQEVGITHEWVCKIENGKAQSLSTSLIIKLMESVGMRGDFFTEN